MRASTLLGWEMTSDAIGDVLESKRLHFLCSHWCMDWLNSVFYIPELYGKTWLLEDHICRIAGGCLQQHLLTQKSMSTKDLESCSSTVMMASGDLGTCWGMSRARVFLGPAGHIQSN